MLTLKHLKLKGDKITEGYLVVVSVEESLRAAALLRMMNEPASNMKT